MKNKSCIKKFVFLTILILSVHLSYRYGRSVYMPIVNKVKTQNTAESVKEKLYDQVTSRLQKNLSDIELQELPQKFSILAFKEEQILEVWAYIDTSYHLLKSYPFSATSGTLGPKLREGDKQIPEGIYNIEYLNPNSKFYLSLKVSYPNDFEKQKAILDYRTDIGSDIFIHGKDVTVGCIPLGDRAIEEVFVMAKQTDHKAIEVIISPRDFRVNPNYPDIDHVPWSEELYDIINKKLAEYINVI